ncbi:hypothetical protein RM863_12685 [Streptomyces sp. DSM 41014]|uniref:HNH endonuclease n=1 Tax=Streptomyces hintoniae TaxID=3075521 RepID=A0ABU2UIJ0_9ACTN|nr:hypothetical protein [Streptomyces sp. DSM 41014]MDT0472980.1 hypothetical protein [Streptomyces sp. DSM 41014]
MTLKVYRRLWCDGQDDEGRCPNWFNTAEFPDEDPARIRRSARLDGWSRRRRDGHLLDLCPECDKPTTA